MSPAESREAALALAKLEGWRQPVAVLPCAICGRQYAEEFSGPDLLKGSPPPCIPCEAADKHEDPYDKARWFYVDTLSQE